MVVADVEVEVLVSVVDESMATINGSLGIEGKQASTVAPSRRSKGTWPTRGDALESLAHAAGRNTGVNVRGSRYTLWGDSEIRRIAGRCGV